MGLSDGRKSFRTGLAVLIQYRSVTDTQPASQPVSQPASHVAVAITLNAQASSLKIVHIVQNNEKKYMRQSKIKDRRGLEETPVDLNPYVSVTLVYCIQTAILNIIKLLSMPAG